MGTVCVSLLGHAKDGGHLIEAEDRVVAVAKVHAAYAVPEEGLVELVGVAEVGEVARVLVNLSRAPFIRGL